MENYIGHRAYNLYCKLPLVECPQPEINPPSCFQLWLQAVSDFLANALMETYCELPWANCTLPPVEEDPSFIFINAWYSSLCNMLKYIISSSWYTLIIFVLIMGFFVSKVHQEMVDIKNAEKYQEEANHQEEINYIS